MPEGITAIGDYAFEKCNSLADVSFEGSTGLELGEYEFYKTDGVLSIHMILPDDTVINDTTISGAAIGGIFVRGAGKLKTASGKDLLIENGQIYESGGTVLVNALPEKYDSGSEEWVAVTEIVSGDPESFTRYTVDPDVVRIAAGAFDGRKFDNVVLPAGIETLDDKAFYGAEIEAISISGDNSKYDVVDGTLCEIIEAAEDETGSYRLLRYSAAECRMT